MMFWHSVLLVRVVAGCMNSGWDFHVLTGQRSNNASRPQLKRGGAYSVLMGGGVSIPYVALRVVLGALRLGPRTSLSVLIPKGCGVQLEEIVELFAAGKLRMAEVAGRFGPEEAGKARRVLCAASSRPALMLFWCRCFMRSCVRFPLQARVLLIRLSYAYDIMFPSNRRTSWWAASNQGAKC